MYFCKFRRASFLLLIIQEISHYFKDISSVFAMLLDGLQKYTFINTSIYREEVRIVAIAAGYENTVGLRSDGTVLTVADADDVFGLSDVCNWANIRTPNKEEQK